MAAVEEEWQEPGRTAAWKCAFPTVIATLILLYVSNNYFKKLFTNFKKSQLQETACIHR